MAPNDTNPTSESSEPEDPKIIAHSVKAACAKVNVGRSFLYGEIARGALRARKAGRRTLIMDADLQDWLRSLPLM